MKSFTDSYIKFLPWFEAKFRTLPLPKEPAVLYQPLRYVLEGKGKRIRPALCASVAEAFGIDREQSLAAALALELIHNFSLVHDDIMDGDDMRHGLQTVHTRWNTNTAIMAGDTLFALAFQQLEQLPEKYFHAVHKVFTRNVLEISEGQMYDLDFENRPDVTLDDYLMMSGKKTGALLSGAALLGAILGGADTATVSAVESFILRIGRIFQIQDDVLELTSESTAMGKSLGSDIAEDKKTYPIIVANQLADLTQKQELAVMMNADFIGQHGLEPIRELFGRIGVWDTVNATIEQERIGALHTVNPLFAELKHTLITFSEFILDRKR